MFKIVNVTSQFLMGEHFTFNSYIMSSKIIFVIFSIIIFKNIVFLQMMYKKFVTYFISKKNLIIHQKNILFYHR